LSSPLQDRVDAFAHGLDRDAAIPEGDVVGAGDAEDPVRQPQTAEGGGAAGLKGGRVAVGQAELEADVPGFAAVECERPGGLVAAAEAGVAVGGEAHAIEAP